MSPESHIKHIDLNCDLGEYENLTDGHADAAIMPYISSCNIACGGHAGTASVMAQSVQWAKQNQLRIGAHPSFPDRENFGRHAMNINEATVKETLKQQITTLKGICFEHGVPLSYVKPHGALYNMAADDLDLSLLLIEVMQSIDDELSLMGLSHSQMQLAAAQIGIPFIAEAFIDRRYTAARRLQNRSEAGAVLHDFEAQSKQALALASGMAISSHSGQKINISCQSLCLHGDTPQAAESAQLLNRLLIKNNIQIHA